MLCSVHQKIWVRQLHSLFLCSLQSVSLLQCHLKDNRGPARIPSFGQLCVFPLSSKSSCFPCLSGSSSFPFVTICTRAEATASILMLVPDDSISFLSALEIRQHWTHWQILTLTIHLLHLIPTVPLRYLFCKAFSYLPVGGWNILTIPTQSHCKTSPPLN